jgi:hypothetical protein
VSTGDSSQQCFCYLPFLCVLCASVVTSATLHLTYHTPYVLLTPVMQNNTTASPDRLARSKVGPQTHFPTCFSRSGDAPPRSHRQRTVAAFFLIGIAVPTEMARNPAFPTKSHLFITTWTLVLPAPRAGRLHYLRASCFKTSSLRLPILHETRMIRARSSFGRLSFAAIFLSAVATQRHAVPAVPPKRKIFGHHDLDIGPSGAPAPAVPPNKKIRVDSRPFAVRSFSK